MNFVCEGQAGFRKGYSTMDHILILNVLLICICIQRKAFGSVSRLALLQKLLQQNINEKC